MKKNYFKKNTIKLLKNFIVVIFMFGFHNAFSQGATCATATVASVNVAYAGLTSDTTVNDPVVAACNTQTISSDGWVLFVATGTEAIVSITANRNPVLYAYSGTCGSLNFMSCANAVTSNGNQTETLTLSGLTPGSTYYIRIGNTLANTMTIASFSVVTNNQCSNAIQLPCGTTNLAGTTNTTASYTNGTGCPISNNGVWYTFTGDGNPTTISATTTAFDLKIAIASGSCGSLVNVGCQDVAGASGTDTYTFTPTLGTTYYVYIAYFQAGATTGNFTISRTCPPTNNQCSAATSLPCGTTNLPGTTVNAISYTHGTGCAISNYGVWYTFVGDGISTTISATTTALDIKIAVASGSCGSLVNVGCQDVAGASGTDTYTFTPTLGTTYYVYIAYYQTGTNTGTFTISRSCATPPANNDCAGAIGLTVNPAQTCTSTTAGTTINATQSLAGCSGTADDDVWYSFVATGTSNTITVTPTTLTDVVFQVFNNGVCGSLTNMACVNSTTAAAAETITLSSLTLGLTYYVRVYSSGSGTGQGTFNICVTSPPANDECTGAVGLTVNPAQTCTSTTSGSTINASQSLAGCSGTADDDVWYSFVATGTSNTITVTPTSLTDVVFQVFNNGACGSLTGMSCVNSTTAAAAETTTLTGLTSGLTYYVRVYSSGNATGQGTFSICVTTPPTNDDCTGAIGLTVNPAQNCTSTTTGTTLAATQSLAGCSGTADDDVWYSFVATGTSHTITATPTTLTDIVFQVFNNGACGSLTSMICVNNTTAAAAETTVLTGLTAGLTYYVRVYSSGNATGQGAFSICVTTPPANDECTGAIGLTVNPAQTCTSTTAGTTLAATQSLVGCSGTADDDVWYSFVATGASNTITVTPTTLTDVVFQVFNNGACGSLTSMSCVNSTTAAAAETTILTGLTAGLTYYVRVYSSGNGTGQGTFSICVTSPPANDECTGAIGLTVNPAQTCTSTTSGTTINATQSLVGCSGTADDDVWYSFVATGASNTITVTPTSLTDVVFQVFNNGACGSLTSMSCVNSTTAAAAETTILTGLTAGVTYYVRVYSNGNGTGQGTFTVCVTSPPANDECTGAIGLTVNPAQTCTSTTSGTTINATQSLAGCSGTADDDVWYSFVATGASNTITVTPTSLTDVVFQVFNNGACGSLTSMSCVNSTTAAAAETTILTGLTAGVTYYVRVYSNGNGTGQGTFSVCVTSPPANDECTGAIGLTVNPAQTCTSTTSGTTINATQSLAGCSGTADDDVWYSFVATGTSNTITVTPTSLTDVVFQVFNSGTCGSLTSMSCVNSTTAAAAETSTLAGLTAGVTYYVRVYSNGNGTGQGTFSVCVTSPPANNECTGAVALTVNSSTTCTTSTTGTTTAASQSLAGCSGTADDDVWYSFVASGTSHIVTVTPTTLTDVVFQVFNNGTCGSLTSMTCVNNTLAAAAETTTLTGLTAGLTYYVRVYSSGSATGQGTFSICVTTPLVNNQCINAISLPCSTFNLPGTTVGAVNYTHNSGCAMSDYGVWYKFTGDGYSNTISVTTTSYDIEIAIASGSCGSLVNIGCQDVAGASGTDSYTFTTTLGTPYYVYIAHYQSGNTTTGTFTISRTCASPPVNDDCSGAIPLTVSTTCSYTTYSNANATASLAAPAVGGAPAPGCGSYLGGDIWFTAVVPANGVLTVDTQTGVMTDADMAFYSGTCGSLTLLECDDFDSSNGSMPYISMTGLNPGDTIYIRVWEYGNNNNGTFGICATTPTCPPPTNLFANIISTTSALVYWTGTVNATSGYQYFITTTNSPPTAGSTPSGTTASGVVGVSFTGLTSGQIYYVWVRSDCSAGDRSTWYGPTNFTPCAVGNHTGTTSLSCPTPSANVQGAGVDVNGNLTMACNTLTCASLDVSYATIKQTTDYTVASIAYAPPYQFKCLENPVSVNVDDRWSPTIILPFDFCYYGNSYNKCLIGSNGVLTFDTVNNTAGGYSNWSFANNLPNTSLFKNTVFGVYHDIDPSKGGQVGWELVTLNSGCRALVASWSDIPMFSSSCNSSLYTGMIVLYENTNVIDVYIKEKNVCSTWNDGNAIVGLQNATGTAAVVAPGRNGLDTNWTVGGSGEAWRFTPNGATVVPTVQWYQGSISAANAIAGATSTTLNVCPTVSTSYIAEVNYPLCTGAVKFTDNAIITITGNKIWTSGALTTDWNTAGNWSPNGVPNNTNCVIIPVVGSGRYPSITSIPDAVGYNLAVYSNASLTVGTSQNLTITDKITIQSPSTGAVTVNNNANLVQINDTAVNTGSINYKRIAPGIKGSDYVYWSSPVASQNMGTFYDIGTPGLKYQWNTTLNNNNGAGGNISQGIWEGASGLMTTARGYIIRGSTSFGAAASNIATTFTGKPINGVIPYTVLRGSYTGAPYNGANGSPITNLNDNYNLLGNPYPSSINALKFLQLNAYNASTNPSGVILGNVKLWTHSTDPLYGVVNPFYGTYLYNYDANDYLTLNYLGSTTPGLPDIIKSGQAFFVQMIDGATGSGTVNFNNSMRFDASNLPYSNSNFFKNGNNPYTSEISLERHRIWLDLVDANNQSSGILLGYATDATNNYDSLFDAPTAVPATMKLFSMIENDSEVYDIQGRSLPFDINDEIPIGIKAPTQGNYTFAIAAVDGLFDTQNIYLKDNLLNITHDLKVSPYHFTTISGAIKDRFKVVYINNALGTTEHSIDNNIKVITNQEVAVSSSNLQMESIDVYNVLGQKLVTYKGISTNYFILTNLHKNNTTLFLKIKLQTGETVTKKIIF